MPDSEDVVVVDGGVSGSNRVAADIHRAVAEVADNQQPQGHLRQPRCPAVVRLPHRIPDSHSIAWNDIFFLRNTHW